MDKGLEYRVHGEARMLLFPEATMERVLIRSKLFDGCLLQLALRGERHTNKEPRLIYIMVLVARIHR